MDSSEKLAGRAGGADPRQGLRGLGVDVDQVVGRVGRFRKRLTTVCGGGQTVAMVDLVHLSLPGRGTGFTLRQPSRWWRRPDYVEFLADDGRVWLFRELSQLQVFLGTDTWPAPYWRDLLEADDREPAPGSAERYDLFQMINGHLRWTDGDEDGPCSDLCVELAFACESWELLDELSPCFRTRDHKSWRRIIQLVVPMVRFWGEPDEPVDSEVIEWAMTASFYHGP